MTEQEKNKLKHWKERDAMIKVQLLDLRSYMLRKKNCPKIRRLDDILYCHGKILPH